MRAVLDTNVLVDALVRDIFLTVAHRGGYQFVWSAVIEKELRDTLLTGRFTISAGRVSRLLGLMHGVREMMYVNPVPEIVLQLPDPDDRHIVAAALEANASTIVTFNVRHFPTSVLGPIGLRGITPEVFLDELFFAQQSHVINAIREIATRYGRPPVTPVDLMVRLASRREFRTVADLIQTYFVIVD